MLSYIASELLSNWEHMLKIILSSVCGGLIGFERSLRHKDAGIRTHIILSMGTALFAIISRCGFASAAGDATRIAANIVTGIGFLGAGVIFVRGGSIKGLTTAAGIWTTAGIGMAIGSGMYTLGIFSTFFMVAVQFLLHRISPSPEGAASVELTATYRQDSDFLQELQRQSGKLRMEALSVKAVKNKDGTCTAALSLRVGKEKALTDFLSLAAASDKIIDFSVSL